MKKLILATLAAACLASPAQADAYTHEATAKERTRDWAINRGYWNVRVGDCARRSGLTVDCIVRFDTYWGGRCAWVVRVTPNLTRGLNGDCSWHTNPSVWL